MDASVGVKWVLEEDHSDKAEALARDADLTQTALAAPPLILGEVSNVLRQRMRRAGLVLEEARAKLARFGTFPVFIEELPGLYDRALLIADQYALPAAYDGIYVALAQMRGDDLWTADRRLLNALGGGMPFVKWIGDYPTR